ncbi:lipid asymmetry maintenance protein MlaB [Thioalkalivibrio sp. ALJ16]|uniref:STAS domain-containing protein n=1 Tax=Thioalkalivibrio sp. ALJ16 TaxID=1158762 RepID=UPI00035C9EC0|nr:STAS domain-containing protein [Thioalkalivibrio sp. ALJ16]
MTTITLPDRLRIDTVAECWEALHAAIDHGQPVMLQAGAVQAIDAAGAQMLLFAEQTARAQGQPVAYESCSDTLEHALGALGLADLHARMQTPPTIHDPN